MMVSLELLADDIRAFILDVISKTGGHLAAGLGTVELSISLHHIFDTPEDKIIWDVGHQCYPHKILTGRKIECLQFVNIKVYLVFLKLMRANMILWCRTFKHINKCSD